MTGVGACVAELCPIKRARGTSETSPRGWRESATIQRRISVGASCRAGGEWATFTGRATC